MKGISVVITAVLGEEKYLPSCLTSIKNMASEIVIVDMSGGKEVSLAVKKFKAKVYKHEFVNYVEPVRNFGISKAQGDWILILDPDEELSGGLIKRLEEILENNEADYVRVPRRNIVFGKRMEHSRWWPDYNIRFFKKGKVTWSEIIHGVPTTEGRGIDLKADNNLAIVHHHYESIEQFILRMNRYTSVQSERIQAEGYKFVWTDLIERPAGEFLSRYFAGDGYKDGVHGLALSLLQAFSELVLYLKVWQKEKFTDKEIGLSDVVREIGSVESEIHYWQADAMVKQGGGVLQKVKRRFKLR